jgi:hypothetical protein
MELLREGLCGLPRREKNLSKKKDAFKSSEIYLGKREYEFNVDKLEGAKKGIINLLFQEREWERHTGDKIWSSWEDSFATDIVYSNAFQKAVHYLLSVRAIETKLSEKSGQVYRISEKKYEEMVLERALDGLSGRES